MARYVFDIECNGFLDTVTTIHCLVLLNMDTGEMVSCGPQDIEIGLNLLRDADEITGHNVLAFDLPVIEKIYPDFSTTARITDTLVLARLIHSDIKNEDAPRLAAKAIEAKLYGSHSLEAWGQRLGFRKLQYTGGFDKWTTEMQGYCEQDVRVTKALYNYLKPYSYSAQATALEHDMMELCASMEREGWPFDVPAALKLYAELAGKRQSIKNELSDLFPPWETVDRVVTYKRPNKAKGIKAGDTVTHMKTVFFNPSSRQHIAKCLTDKYGWKPSAHTENGQPKIDDEVLTSLPYPEAKKLAEYFLIEKRIGQLAEGDNAWLKLERNGRIHARYNPNGTVTGRATHSNPNIAQVPSVRKSKDKGILYGIDGGWGYECRSLFKPPEGMTMVGADMSGLELRCLAHYMARYDQGDYAKVVTEGDVHTANMEAAGLTTRDHAKRFIYAFLYGASARKIAEVLECKEREAKAVMERFKEGLPALANLKSAIDRYAAQGFIPAIDGRRIPVRSPHAALNSLLQASGSVLCKAWLLGIRDELETQGLHWGSDYYFLGWVHDEVQIAVRKGLESHVGETAVGMASKVGESFSFRCPLAAEYRQGASWAETH